MTHIEPIFYDDIMTRFSRFLPILCLLAEKLIVSGIIIYEKMKKGLPGLRVEAYDKDYITKDDYFGSAETYNSSCFKHQRCF